MISTKTIERYFQNWAQYDRQTFNEMMLKAESENLTKKKFDFGDLFKKNKKQLPKLENFYKTIKNQYGTVTSAKKEKKEHFKNFIDSLDSDTKTWLNKMKIKNKNAFNRLLLSANKLETYFWDFYSSSDAMQLMLINDGKSESERIKNVIQWLNNRNDFTFGKVNEKITQDDIIDNFD